MNKPYLSIVIPAYNEEKFLLPLLHSLYWQTLDRKLYEIIIVDNNSLDNTYNLAKRSLKLFKEIAITVLEETRQGVSFARNHGGRRAHGQIIVFLDTDNIASPQLLEAIYKKTHNEKYLAGTIRALPIENSMVGFFVHWTLEFIKITFKKPFGKNFCTKEVFEAIGGYNTQHDQQLWYLGTNLEFLLRVKKYFQFNKRKGLTHIESPIYTSLRRFESKVYFPILFRWGLVYIGIPEVCKNILNFLAYSRT